MATTELVGEPQHQTEEKHLQNVTTAPLNAGNEESQLHCDEKLEELHHQPQQDSGGTYHQLASVPMVVEELAEDLEQSPEMAIRDELVHVEGSPPPHTDLNPLEEGGHIHVEPQ